jgi:heat shock protein HtpX
MINPTPRRIDPDAYQPPAPPAEPWVFEEQIAANRRGTLLLMVVFCLVAVGIVYAAGYLLGAREYAVTLAIAAAVVAFFSSYASYYHSDSLVLSMSQARPIAKAEFPFLVNTLEGLCLAAGLPEVPKLYLIEDSAPNAFATGRDPAHSAIAVTRGLVDKLDRYQLEGVLAHELSHVVNRDILLSTVAAVMVGMIVLLGDWVMRSLYWGGGRRRSSDRNAGALDAVLLVLALLAVVLGPIIAQLMQLAVSRQREYLADAHAIKLTRYPDGLAGALQAIAADTEPLEVANKATAHLYISNPLRDHGESWLNTLFSTHPPIEERIERIQRM